MQWREPAIILGARKHGESAVIVDVLTAGHGRHAGVVRGGRSKRLRPILQQGNLVDANWRARLSEHLGSFTIEPLQSVSAIAMAEPKRLAGLISLTSLCMLLPEREPEEVLYETARLVINALENDAVWPALLVRWEAGLLDALGFGLSLEKCAATGQVDDLIYVSPKTGRAVSARAGEPFRDKLLPLPAFLTMPGKVSQQDLIDGFSLTGFFLSRHVFTPRGLEMPESRSRLIDYLRCGA